jgi:hypothetical protein
MDQKRTKRHCLPGQPQLQPSLVQLLHHLKLEYQNVTYQEKGKKTFSAGGRKVKLSFVIAWFVLLFWGVGAGCLDILS